MNEFYHQYDNESIHYFNRILCLVVEISNHSETKMTFKCGTLLILVHGNKSFKLTPKDYKIIDFLTIFWVKHHNGHQIMVDL